MSCLKLFSAYAYSELHGFSESCLNKTITFPPVSRASVKGLTFLLTALQLLVSCYSEGAQA